MIIDVHAHVIPPSLTRDANPSDTWLPHVFWEDGSQVIDFAGKHIRSAVREFVRIDRILEEQDRSGVDRVLLCPWVSMVRYDAPPDAGLAHSMAYNQALAELAEAEPAHVSVLGTVPLQDPSAAVKVLETIMDDGRIKGVEVAASVSGTYLGDDRFEPFWEAVESQASFVFIHPTTRGFNADAFQEYYLWNTVGNPLETTICAAHMVMAGVMERHPNLKVLLAHGGGALPALRGRLGHAHGFQPQARARLNETPEASLKRFFFDTLTHDPVLLKQLVALVGADHVLLGSDYPFDMGSTRPTDIVTDLDVADDDKDLILGKNAIRLLGLEDS